ncbi:ABC transporter permease subunit [Aeromicrobium sp. YIM 150415]|uniref:ABC transporter permease n=1 Tax=Aeromicrobium sp. YIM 150415 TaxID=2803912 RepID=UPI00196397DE|nr:ABC transporter permease subunit [Aeromicrobium sp. YIM 150415]MBM9464504.1 ABC transporter permease subunit [Aeromicrobium sp. YIM 150415]
MSIKVARLVAGVIGVLLVWSALAAVVQSGDDPLAQAKLPFPHQLVELIIEQREALVEASWLTLQQALIGFVIGSLVGALFAVIVAQATWMEAGFIPLLLAAQMVPMIALVPVMQNIFRNDDLVRIFISAFITFFSVTVAVARGMKTVRPEAYELAASYNASRVDLLRRVQLPSAVPMLFTGLRVAAPLSIVGSVLVDFAGAQSGLGYIMVAAITIGSNGSMIVWAAMLILLALGFLLTLGVTLLERLVAPWQLAKTEGN